MLRIFNQHRVLPKAVPSVVLVLATMLTLAGTPSFVAASSHARAVTTTSVAYSLSGQMGAYTLAGWVSGTKDSTGIVTATVTVADPTTNAPITENLNGHIVGSGSSAEALFAVTPIPGSTTKGMALTYIMAGATAGNAGAWAGTITMGGANAGAWMLTPQTSTFNINFGGKSAATSKDKVSVSGLISGGATATGWAAGTYTSFDGSVTTVVHGWMNSGGDFEFTIPWGKAGTVVLVGLQGKVKLTHPSWSGTFIGPGVGDMGTWIGQG